MAVRRNNSGSILATIASIALGGAAAVYVGKNILSFRDGGARPAAVVAERQPIVEDEPPVMWQEIPRKTPPKALALRPNPVSTPTLEPSPSPPPVPIHQATKRPPAVVAIASAPRPVAPVPPAPKARSPWIEQMDGIFSKMPSMRNQYDALREPMLPVFKTIDQLVAERSELTQQRGAVSRAATSVSSQLRQAISLSQVAQNDSDRSAAISAASRLESQLSDLNSTRNSLGGQIEEIQQRINQESAKVADFEKAAAPIVAEGRRMEATMLDLLDPFAQLPLPEADAIPYFEEGVEIKRGGDVSWSHFGLGCLKLRAGDARGAMDSLDEAIAAAPGQAMFASVRGIATLAEDKTEGTKRIAAAATLDPKNGFAQCCQIQMLIRLGVADAALLRLNDLIRDLPNDPNAFRLAAMWKATSTTDSHRKADYALTKAKRAVEIDGDSWRATIALAAALAESGDFRQAQIEAQRAAETAPALNRDACRLVADLFAAGKPLRIDWKDAKIPSF